MLTLQLTLDNAQVTVRANELQSHSFSIRDLDNTDLKNFVNDPKPYGGKLFQALFKDGSEAHKAFDELSKQSERTIVIVLESSELDGITWEYAYHDNAYIVEDFAFIRALPEKERPRSNGRMSKNVERVPLLFIPANPLVDLSGDPMHELGIESEWREMTKHIVRSNAPFDLIELRPATPAALQSVMARFQNGMIAHFSGHGAATKDGAFLLFENENGSSNPLEAREFVREVKDQAWIGFLSACQSAVAERTEYSNLARELVKAGVPFALGMQFNLPDPFAPNISGQFYNYLSQGHAVPEAARQARRAVKREDEFYVGMIALYTAHPDEAGKMGWTGSGARALFTFTIADVSDLPTPSGFIGRQRELMNIGTSLLGKKKPNTVTLHGAGGIGKTALMRQTLLRFAPSFESALAIALDPLPSLESVLGRLERFLNLSSPCANDTKEREKIVRERLTSKRTLLGLDNFETLNYALNEKDSDEEKTAKSLHSLFKYLAANGVTLCVTSREVTNLGGETIEDIQGLSNKNGGRLFQDNVVRQKEEIYIEKTQRVSEMVGGHPLALRLLASAFDDQVGTSLDQYIEDLQSHLPKARDKWTEEDRHESLRASFDFTMSNLLKMENGKQLEDALASLSVFIAFFFSELASPVIAGKWTEIAEEKNKQDEHAKNIAHTLWERGLLERTVLALTDESIPLYRLHPALGVFAKQRLTDVQTVREIYWKSMNNFARMAETQVRKSPFMAQIASHTMPDLILASESKSGIDVAPMQYMVSNLLKQFGLYDDALRLLEKSRSIYRSLNQQMEMAVIIHAIAQIYFIRGDLDIAMKLFARSLEIKEGLGDLKGKAVTIGEIARIEEMRGNLDNALEMQEQKIAITKQLGDQRETSIALHNLAGIYAARGDLDRAMQLYAQSFEIAEGLGDLKVKSDTLHEMARIYVTRGDLDGAMQLYTESLKITEGLGDLKGKADTFHQMAGIYAAHDDLDGAMQLYGQSLEIFESLGDLTGKSDTFHGMARIYVKRGNLEGALQLYMQSLGIKESLGNLKGKATLLHDMANIYAKRGDLDEAIKLYSQSLGIKEGLDDRKGIAVTLHQMAGIYAKRGDLDMAIKLYEQSLKVTENLGELKGKASTLAMLGQLLVMQKKYPRAITALLKSMETFSSIGADTDVQKVSKILVIVWQEIGIEEFYKSWKEITDQPLPNWLV